MKKQKEGIICDIHKKETGSLNLVYDGEVMMLICFKCFIEKLRELGLKDYK